MKTGKSPPGTGGEKRYSDVLFFRGLPGLIRRPGLGRGWGLFALFPLIEEYGCDHDHSNQRYAGNRRPEGNIALIACLRCFAIIKRSFYRSKINTGFIVWINTRIKYEGMASLA